MRYGKAQVFGLLLIGVALLAACGGGATDPGANPKSFRLVANASAVISGTACANGGAKIDSGFDVNGNNVLDPSEITSTQYVCTPPNGANGLNALVKSSVEPAAVNCANGGYKVEVGLDANSNGTLDAAEVTSTGYVCAGSNATNGVDGFNSLMAIVPETAGSNCTYGGSKITYGLDTNRNNTLDAGEVTIATTTYLCSGPATGIGWVRATADTQAISNTGYFTDSLTALTITLPANPATGDVVAVNGVGAGGWKIAQNAGQSINLKNAVPPGQFWIARDAQRNWKSVASSADGTKLVAVEAIGSIFTSTDSGVTWVKPPADPRKLWRQVASSADGSKLFAINGEAVVYLSTDSGVTWTTSPVAPAAVAGSMQGIATSSDGTKLVLTTSQPFSGGLTYTSTDSGVTWTPGMETNSWTYVASSADGNKLVAVVGAGTVHTSTNAGATWVLGSVPGNSWTSVASSADGVYLVLGSLGGQMWRSSDSGVTWVGIGPGIGWQSVASSADGTHLVAAARLGYLYTSADSGKSWTGRESIRDWTSVATSASGTKLLAGVAGLANLYTSDTKTTTGTAGFVAGRQLESVELQYLWNGQWDVFNHVGSLSYF
jgi:hypothetical protein